MYILKHKYTHRLYAVFTTYGAALAQYECERNENFLVELYEVPDNDITVRTDHATKIKDPSNHKIDQHKEWKTFEEIMGLSEA